MRTFFYKSVLLALLVGTSLRLAGQLITGDLILYNQRFKTSKLESNEAFRMIILGDSRALAMNWGVYPGVYNFSLVHLGGLLGHHWMFTRYLQRHPAPSTVILSVIPETFAEPYDVAISRDSVYLLPLTVLWSTLQPLTWDKVWQFFQARFDLRDRLLMQLCGEVRKEWFQKASGVMLFGPEEAEFRFHPKSYLVAPYSDTFTPSENALRWLRQFVQVAEAHGVRVLLFTMPVPKSVYEHHRPFFSQFREWADQLPRQIPGLAVHPPYRPPDLWPDRYFLWDGLHLNPAGARYFDQTRFREILAWAGRVEQVQKHAI